MCWYYIDFYLYWFIFKNTSYEREITAYKAGIWGFISILGVTCVVGGGR